jgi:hypothetical protein
MKWNPALEGIAYKRFEEYKKIKLVDYITISYAISSKKTEKFACLEKRNR